MCTVAALLAFVAGAFAALFCAYSYGMIKNDGKNRPP